MIYLCFVHWKDVFLRMNVELAYVLFPNPEADEQNINISSLN